MKQSNELKKENKIDEDFILKCSCKLLEKAEIKTAPVDPGILASFRDIKRVIEKDMGEAGILIPSSTGGAEIYLRKQDRRNRKRFTCCHEIVHTFFPDYQLHPQKRIDKEVGEYQKDNWVEYLCDLGASELLMPLLLFRPLFLRENFSINSLLSLSKRFESSLEATAIKMIKQNPQKTALVIWEEKYKPVERIIEFLSPLPGFEKYKPPKKLRIRFACGFENLGYIPKDKSLEETKNVIQKSFIENKKQSGLEEINFGNFIVRCKVETLPLEYRDQKRIFSLLYKIEG